MRRSGLAKYCLKRDEARRWMPPLHTDSLDWMLIDRHSFPEAKYMYLVYCEMEPGGCAQKHVHTRGHEQGLYILEGKAKVQVNDESFEAGPETVVFVPEEAEHEIKAMGKEKLKLLVWICPPLSSYEKGSISKEE